MDNRNPNVRELEPDRSPTLLLLFALSIRILPPFSSSVRLFLSRSSSFVLPRYGGAGRRPSSIQPPLSSSTVISSRRHDHAFFLPSSCSSFDFQPIISCSIAHFALPTARIRNNRLVVSSRKNSSLHQSSSLYHHSSLLQSCIASGSLDLGRSILAQMLIRGLHPDPFLQAKILMLYVRNGGNSNLVTARHLFDTITERNLTAWNTMILSYAQVGGRSEVIDLFLRMIASGICPGRFIFPSVIKGFHCSRTLELHPSGSWNDN